MNGARSTFMCKGYWLTALAAIVLLAASSGTAQAQTDVTATLEAPSKVTEGSDITITVKGKATVAAGQATAQRVTVVLDFAASSVDGVTAEIDETGNTQVDDVTIVSNPTATLTFAANTGGEDRVRTASTTVTVRTNNDDDAENEVVYVTATDSTAGVTVDVTNTEDRVAFTIVDDETQTYALSLARTHTSTNPPKEAADVMATIAAKPPHYDDGVTLTLNIIQNGKRPSGYTAAGPGDDGDWVVKVGTDVLGDTEGTAGVTENTRTITITPPDNDKNRVTDTITLEAHSGPAGSDKRESSLDIDLLDVNLLPAASAITAVAKDADGNVVTEIMEGGDPVFLTITVDRGRGEADRITDEALEVDLRAANAAQVADYELSESRIVLESLPSGKQSNDVDVKIELSARSDEDVGMEYLMLNLDLSGDSTIGKETSTGTFSIGIVDDTTKKVEPRSEADAYPMIRAALGNDPETTVMNIGETGTIMTSDLFTVMDGYTASYGVSVGGGAVSVSASSDSVTVSANALGESKVTVTARASMAASSFLPEQTMSDEASITFAVMVEEAAAPVVPEPVPALPLIAQWLLGLGLMGGGARQLFRRRRQG